MNNALFRLNEMYTMLHYPMYQSEGDSFLDAQTNLTNYCISLLPSVKGKMLLDVGCGNGVQTNYIFEKYAPGYIKAVDISAGNIDVARQEAETKYIDRVEFCVDDAHLLATVEDNSVDFLINIESAFHYPEKAAFFKQIHRVLKPGGSFVIADILTTKINGNRVKDTWEKRMALYHWHLESYNRELPTANLQMLRVYDITSDIIRGFSLYRKWLRDMDRHHFMEDMILRLFYTVHVRLNMYLLRTRRQYCVIVGKKPDDSLSEHQR